MNFDCFALFGTCPEATDAPPTTEEAQHCVRKSHGKAIAPWGGGTRQETGYAPERYDIALSTENLNAIVDYQPADLTVTVQAGVTLSALQAALANNRQWLPLDVALPDQQTIGGIVAARADSLRRFSFGSVRDSLLGLTVVNALGEKIKAGGRVVKNVAGYDLPKMYCGSWGTLGLITEATFKVAPLPETSAVVLRPLDANHNSEDALDQLLGGEIQPSFLTLLSPLAAGDILERDSGMQVLVIGFDGYENDVKSQIAALGAGDEVLMGADAASLRSRLRDYPLRSAPMACAFHILSSQVGAYVRMVEWTASKSGFAARIMADAALGIVSAHFSPMRDDADWLVFHRNLAEKAVRVGGSFIIERMPNVLRAADIAVWSPLLADFALMRRLKDTLDPDHMWNPGRFIGKL